MRRFKWKYALGEVAIVIVGVSVAFALNNWRENEKSADQRNLYLENLRSDVTSEIAQLEEINSSIQDKQQRIQRFRKMIHTPNHPRDSLLPHFFAFIGTPSFNPENSTYKALINSGDLKLIKDFNLRREIERHYGSHARVQKHYQRMENIQQTYLGDLFIYDMDYGKFRQGDYSLFDQLKVQNIINSLDGALGLMKEGNQECIASNEVLLVVLNQESFGSSEQKD